MRRNHVGSVIVSMLASNALGRMFDPRQILFLYTELLGSLFNIMSIDTVSVHGIAGVRV
jgi:hypothetical protein